MKARTTKNVDVALARAAELLPLNGGTALVETAGDRKRVLTYESPAGKQVVIQGTPERCLYAACLVLTADPRYDGFGDSVESVRDALQFHPLGIHHRGVAAHEEQMLHRVAIELE